MFLGATALVQVNELKDITKTIEEFSKTTLTNSEANTKNRIIEPLLEALGWDIRGNEVVLKYPSASERLFGSRRRYTVATYFSNRLDVYSHKPYSILVPFTRYREGKYEDYRKTTREERKVFGNPWIATYKKKPKNKKTK